ncbi:recombinase family protein [Microbacterium sp. NPDC090007]|uniref:recombinase family protein n=1 Tax=Microbacterium sp. NPDC090007 TaxID=3364204 RepID=UPI00381F8755
MAAKQCHKKGWSVATLDLDMATTNGETIAHVLMALAQWERRQIGDRTRAALAELKRQEKPYGGRPSKTDLRGEVVNYITMRRDEGACVSPIARELNEAGHLTSPGNRLYPSTVTKLVERVASLSIQN